MRELIKATELCAVVIDKVSMLTPLNLASIDSRLKQAMDNDLPFGEVVIILVGDFTQVPPVGKKLYQGALEMSLRTEQNSTVTTQGNKIREVRLTPKEE
eukprot:6164681-Ditylum_brightwellii.AAC.1